MTWYRHFCILGSCLNRKNHFNVKNFRSVTLTHELKTYLPSERTIMRMRISVWIRSRCMSRVRFQSQALFAETRFDGFGFHVSVKVQHYKIKSSYRSVQWSNVIGNLCEREGMNNEKNLLYTAAGYAPKLNTGVFLTIEQLTHDVKSSCAWSQRFHRRIRKFGNHYESKWIEYSSLEESPAINLEWVRKRRNGLATHIKANSANTTLSALVQVNYLE